MSVRARLIRFVAPCPKCGIQVSFQRLDRSPTIVRCTNKACAVKFEPPAMEEVL